MQFLSNAPSALVPVAADSYALPRSDERAVNVLFVNPLDAGHLQLSSIFFHSKWRLHKAHDFDEAIYCLRVHAPPVVICDTEVPGQCWRRLLDAVRDMEGRPEPRIIVSSRNADDHLWSEVLNLGGYNVLERPFETGEVVWVVSHAWLDWRSETERCSAMRQAAGCRS